MRVVIQRVSKASVNCESGPSENIGRGLLIFLGIETSDNFSDVEWLSSKIFQLRIFPDGEGVMNLDVKQANGEILIISQFTLHASTKKGNRPSYIRAARPEQAVSLYEDFIKRMGELTGGKVKKGVFGDHMNVSLVNDGPVTIFIDTKNKE